MTLQDWIDMNYPLNDPLIGRLINEKFEMNLTRLGISSQEAQGTPPFVHCSSYDYDCNKPTVISVDTSEIYVPKNPPKPKRTYKKRAKNKEIKQ